MENNISISGNRVAVQIEDKTAQFVVYNLEKSQENDLELQIKTAFGICPTFKDIEKHLQINGFNAYLEDIY